jgi:hypothetical protein
MRQFRLHSTHVDLRVSPHQCTGEYLSDQMQPRNRFIRKPHLLSERPNADPVLRNAFKNQRNSYVGFEADIARVSCRFNGLGQVILKVNSPHRLSMYNLAYVPGQARSQWLQ